jgi:hypothetical protein
MEKHILHLLCVEEGNKRERKYGRQTFGDKSKFCNGGWNFVWWIVLGWTPYMVYIWEDEYKVHILCLPLPSEWMKF